MRSGSQLLVQILRDEGVKYVFGNPGTTELALLNTLGEQSDIEYVLALQEASVVGMADGYARATNKPAFVNLHATAGLGNGLGALSNSAYMNTPLVVTAGQQDHRHIVDEPWLSGDLVGLARPLCKWAHEVRSIEELGIILRRAFKDANAYPKGPVFVSLPQNFMEQSSDVQLPPISRVLQRSMAAGLDHLKEILLQQEQGGLAIVAGDEVSSSEALASLVELAELLDVDVYGSALHDSVVFPTSHPLWCGALKPNTEKIQSTLARYNKVFALGARSFMAYVYNPLSPLSKKTELLHLSANPQALALTFPTKWSSVGDIKTSLEELSSLLKKAGKVVSGDALEARRLVNTRNQNSSAKRFSSKLNDVPLEPGTAAYTFLQAVDEQAIIVDESPSTMWAIREHFKTTVYGQYHFSKGGGLGWAMPAAVGVSLHRPDQRVYCLVGDGAAMYSPQALWSAVNLGLAITFVVFNNAEYGVLKDYLRAVYPNTKSSEDMIAMDINKPKIDYQALAKSMGMLGVRVASADQISKQVKLANKTNGPTLIEIKIAASEHVSNV